MQPLAPALIARDSEPNVELLRRLGWSVSKSCGTYCTVWRGRDEVVFEWRDGDWQRVFGRGGSDV